MEIPVGYTVAMSCVVGNRLLLNLRNSQHRLSVYRANTSVAQTSIVGQGQVALMGWPSSMEARIGSQVEVAGTYELHTLRTLRAEAKI